MTVIEARGMGFVRYMCWLEKLVLLRLMNAGESGGSERPEYHQDLVHAAAIQAPTNRVAVAVVAVVAVAMAKHRLTRTR